MRAAALNQRSMAARLNKRVPSIAHFKRAPNSADGRRTVVGLGHSMDRQRRWKKKHLFEAAPFGRLDQMLWTQPKTGGSGGANEFFKLII